MGVVTKQTDVDLLALA